jgi:hypothetical protein
VVSPALNLGPRSFDSGGHHRVELDRHTVQLELSGAEPGKIEQVLHHSREVLRLPRNDVKGMRGLMPCRADRL